MEAFARDGPSAAFGAAMTPLAMELIEDLYSQFHFRPVQGVDGMTDKRLRDVFWTAAHNCKFFDCAEVAQLAIELAMKTHSAFEKYDRVDQRLAFLPAEWTWVEIESPGYRDMPEDDRPRTNEFKRGASKPWNYTYRTAFVFIATNGVANLANKRLRISYETPRQKDSPRVWRIAEMPALPLAQSGLKPQRSMEHRNTDGQVRRFEQPVSSVDDFVHYALLALINTPRIIGQRVHFPHQRIEREKLAKLKLTGKFPLRAWTEIVLKVGLPDDRSGDSSRETHLTGERCLHFCRTYLRIRYGAVEYVEGHWRGDPALGMKRSRYRLQKEQNDSGEVGQRSVDIGSGL
jgi:hypothetical protein